MNIELRNISIRDIYEGYNDLEEQGVFSYEGKLNIRPPYQREFVYDKKQSVAVIETILKGFPLNVMYWVVNSYKHYELLDGQQRTLSICQFVKGDYSIKINGKDSYFHSLTQKEQDNILDYELMIYVCEGEEREKLEWFETINIAGEKLTPQEIKNALYTGEWLSEAKKYFSKTGCPAHSMGSKYLKGSAIRQDYLETILKWISSENTNKLSDKKNISDYMSIHQKDENDNELREYFTSIIKWIEKNFKNYRKEMKGVDYGYLYNNFKDTVFNADDLEEQISKLMRDEDVTKKSGIYTYVITGEEKHLNIRNFSDNQKREAYENQKGICVSCNNPFDIEDMEADHTTPWSRGGKTNSDNCKMLCVNCNRTKSDI